MVAQVANAVFGGSSLGFYIVQAFTAAILILAANTAYQDFPRLASILGRDRYMPSQFVNRGDRLVFSNGVIVLGLLSALMIYVFDANLDRLIHFYVVGVFTSFTLSQSGMVRHWILEGRKGENAMKGWRRSIVINIIGAITTFVVLIVVILSKFKDGAWLSILIMALLVPVFYAIHRHYMWVRSVVHRGVERVGVVGHESHRAARARDRRLGRRGARAISGRCGRSRCTSITARRRSSIPISHGGGATSPAVRRPALDADRRRQPDRRRAAVRGASLDRTPHDVVTVVVPEMVGDHLDEPRRAHEGPRASQGGDARASRTSSSPMSRS